MADDEAEMHDEDAVTEGLELSKVTADMKDKTVKAKSLVASQKARVDFGHGKAVVSNKKGEKPAEVKVGEVSKHTNTIKGEILKAAKTELKDKAPDAGKSPAMPK